MIQRGISILTQVLNWMRTPNGQSWNGLVTIFGFFISLLGFILSVYLLIAAGSIKSHLKKYVLGRQYQTEREVLARRIRTIIKNLRDNDFANHEKELSGSVQGLLARLEDFRYFLPVKARWYMWRSHCITKNGQLKPNAVGSLDSMLSYLKGKLEGKGEFIQ